MVKYILASNSPRRRELLEQAGICFEISPAQGEEISTGDLPADIVEELSRKKATEVAQRYLRKYENDTVVIIGADTVVACQGEIMGKPRDQADASAMLAKLQGGTHQVYTGVTFIVLEQGQGERGQKVVTFHERTDVSMYPMTPEQIAAYVATGEPMDKAGAYAIQGKCAVHIKGINGDYNNVVGLPVARLVHELFEIHLA
ncbi:MAG: Maf family protein [Lachnospiraceae bacterium]|nr:Maf family protein [Lachnospiraceae bacterium]MDE6991539.1 Maf family protein [Lachnospiraceae bacterium]MDE7001159.1 Maf family protein [Lachnospiraceae bacterium]